MCESIAMSHKLDFACYNLLLPVYTSTCAYCFVFNSENFLLSGLFSPLTGVLPQREEEENLGKYGQISKKDFSKMISQKFFLKGFAYTNAYQIYCFLWLHVPKGRV